LQSIFVGFRCQGQIHGCTYTMDSEEQFNNVNARFLNVFNSNDVASLRSIFDSIEWQPFNAEEDTESGVFLLSLLEKGVDGYRMTMRRTLKFLNQGVEYSDIPAEYKHDSTEDDLLNYINPDNGHPRLYDTASGFLDGTASHVYLVDFDANEIHVMKREGDTMVAAK
jgi:hypothetical protein